MFGVVLWSDSQERKAVIWCEDHGDLAFYRQPEQGDSVPLDAGDWVQFDVTMERHMRYAHNPRLVAEGVFAGLAETLGDAAKPGADTPRIRRQSADIIPFAPQPRRDRAGNSVVALAYT